MRTKIFFLLMVLLLAGAKSYCQITLHGKEMSLEKVLKHIQRQTGYTFFYDSGDVEGRKVNINVDNVPLEQALSVCFREMPISFEIVNKTVILTRKDLPQVTDTASFHINGQVIDFSTGQPVPNATVTVLNSNKGALADANGNFQLSGIHAHDKIEIRSVGFEKAVLPVTGLLNSLKTGDTVIINKTAVLFTKNHTYTIGLNSAVTSLDEAIIVAYGTTTQRYNVGSVSVVDASEIELQPVSDVLQALEGRVPGLNVILSSGAPGAVTLAQVRGQNTLTNVPGSFNFPDSYNEPLYIVDGVPLSNQTYIRAVTLAGRGNGGIFPPLFGLSPLNTINPADIESVSVLKDADATSIYGSTGSNGVILITTKRGKTGRDIFNITVNKGITSATITPQMMNTAQYLAMRNEADQNSAHTPTTTQDADLTLFDPSKYTDYSKEFYGGTAQRADIHLSLSGGSAGTAYLVSGGSTVLDYNFPGNLADKRLTLHTSLTHRSEDNKLTIDLGTDYSYDYNNSIYDQEIINAYTLAPNTPNLTDPNGNLVWNYKGFDFGVNTTHVNPLADLQRLANTGIYNLNTHLQIGYQLLPTLKLVIDGGYNRLTDHCYIVFPGTSSPPPDPSLPPGQNPTVAIFENDYSEMINLEPQLKFVKTMGKGTLNILLGGTYRKNVISQSTLLALGYLSDALDGSLDDASSVLGGDNYSIYKYVAVFSRINYEWNGKYVINFTGNRDGSSNFGPARRFGNFGSAGLGWIISEENFIKKALPFLSYAKLSANYGTSGSDGVAAYQYQANWGLNIVGNVNGYQGVTGLNPTNPENPAYGWALNKKLNESLDIGFLNNRIMLNITAYQNKASDQLVDYPEPITTGFNNITANAPATVENKGLELVITSKNIAGNNFKWTTGFNIAHNANKLTAYPNLTSSPNAGYYLLGKPVGGALVVPFVGVDPATGLFNFRKKDGTIVSNPNINPGINGLGGDATEYIDLQPKFTGGFNNTFSYKGFSLSVFFQFVKQTGQNYKYQLYGYKIPGNPYYNLPVQLLSRWQKPGDVSEFQRLTAGPYTPNDVSATTAAYSYSFSSGVYSDASYIRLKNLAFAYTVPQPLLKKIFIKDCTFYIHAENLVTITGYKVGDPETQSANTIPPQRIIAAGVNLTF